MRLLQLGLVWLVLVHTSLSKPMYKKQAGLLSTDPIERAKYIPPPSWHGAITSSSTVYKVFLKPDAWESHLLIWQTAILVDSHERFIFTVISPLEKKLGITLVNPNGQVINTDKIRTEGTVPFGHMHFIANSYILQTPITGTYRVKVHVSAELSNMLPPSSLPNAILICYNKSRYRLHTYLSNYNFIVGSRIGIIARMYQAPNTTFADEALAIPLPISAPSDIITSAVLTVKLPQSGKFKEISMFDDVAHVEDMTAKDKIYGGGFKATEEGEYIAQVTVRGVTPDGSDFTRSTQHVFPVIKKEPKVLPSARTHLNGHSIRIQVDVSGDSPKLFRFFTEVWLHEGNETAPSCWISEYVNVQKTAKNSFFYVGFNLDLHWTKPKAIVVLRNSYLQDLDTNIVTGVCPQIILYETKEVLRDLPAQAPAEHSPHPLDSTVPTPIVFIPDQYAERNPFKMNSDKFPRNSQFFRSSKICHSVHTYAEALATYVEKIPRFSIVAHAFGGLAAVHLLTHYWTALDNGTTTNANPIVTVTVVNAPFKGSPAAGTLAMIGRMYQMECKFSPLSPDIASLWLIGINEQTRSKVAVYSSHYPTARSNDHCCLPMNSLLTSPNDGVVELSRSNLPGANKTINKEGLCHTWNMKYSAQFSDVALIESIIQNKY